MSQNSVIKRIRITRTGKVRRRAMALGHSRSNKRSVSMQRKKRSRGIDIGGRSIRQYFY